MHERPAETRDPEPVADVAISFATADLAVASELSRRLKRFGVRTYHYVETPEVTLGSGLDATLRQVYASARLVIVLHSRWFATSAHTQVELDAAMQGAAGQAGALLPVRIDDTPLPAPLAQLTWWDLGQGTDALVEAVLRRLGRRRMGGTLAFTLAALLTSALLVWFLALLGFRSPGRWPDAAFLAASLLPALWFAVARLLPALLRRRRAARQTSGPLLQSRVERRIELLAPFLIWIIAGTAVVASAAGVLVQRRVVAEDEQAASLLDDLEVGHRLYWEWMSRITAAASRAPYLAAARDWERLRALETQYEALLAEVRPKAEAQRNRLQGSLLAGAGDEAKDYRTKMIDLERNAERNLGHQLRRIAEPPAAGVGDEETQRRKQVLAGLLASWNTLFAEQLIGCDRSFSRVRAAIEARRTDFRRHWYGLLRP